MGVHVQGLRGAAVACRYGPPDARRTPKTLYLTPHGRGAFTSVPAASPPAERSGRALVPTPGPYRETAPRDT
ncbi:hypothetical protein N6Q81_08880, partial [Streptomyces vinaceusdrappus]